MRPQPSPTDSKTSEQPKHKPYKAYVGVGGDGGGAAGPQPGGVLCGGGAQQPAWPAGVAAAVRRQRVARATAGPPIADALRSETRRWHQGTGEVGSRHKWAAVCGSSSLPACRLRASRLTLETGTDSGRRGTPFESEYMAAAGLLCAWGITGLCRTHLRELRILGSLPGRVAGGAAAAGGAHACRSLVAAAGRRAGRAVRVLAGRRGLRRGVDAQRHASLFVVRRACQGASRRQPDACSVQKLEARWTRKHRFKEAPLAYMTRER